MKIKVGAGVWDGKDVPVMVILTKADKKNISMMLPSCTKYCQFPDTVDPKFVKLWMKTPRR